MILIDRKVVYVLKKMLPDFRLTQSGPWGIIGCMIIKHQKAINSMSIKLLHSSPSLQSGT